MNPAVLAHTALQVRASSLTRERRREFEAAGIRHRDLYFDECTTPDDATVRRRRPAPHHPVAERASCRDSDERCML